MHGSHVSFRMKLAKKTNTMHNVWGLSEGLIDSSTWVLFWYVFDQIEIYRKKEKPFS